MVGVAVKERKPNYHNTNTIVFRAYMYIYIIYPCHGNLKYTHYQQLNSKYAKTWNSLCNL